MAQLRDRHLYGYNSLLHTVFRVELGDENVRGKLEKKRSFIQTLLIYWFHRFYSDDTPLRESPIVEDIKI